MNFRPDWHKTKTPLFHITSIDNLASILKSGFLYCKNELSCDHKTIANEDIQCRRAATEVPLAPYGFLHDYVPLYFAPRSPMLCANSHNTHTNATQQDKIIHLVFKAQDIHEKSINYIFYDRHAVLATATPYDNIKYLSEIDWDLFFEPPLAKPKGYFSEYWHNKKDKRNPKWLQRKDIRQAEFLVHKKISYKRITSIATMNDDTKNKVETILNECNVEIKVNVMRGFYF